MCMYFGRTGCVLDGHSHIGGQHACTTVTCISAGYIKKKDNVEVHFGKEEFKFLESTIQ